MGENGITVAPLPAPKRTLIVTPPPATFRSFADVMNDVLSSPRTP